MKPEDAPSSSGRSDSLAIGNSSRFKSRSPKKYKRKSLPSQNLKMHYKQFVYYCDPCASQCILCIPTNEFLNIGLLHYSDPHCMIPFYCDLQMQLNNNTKQLFGATIWLSMQIIKKGLKILFSTAKLNNFIAQVMAKNLEA